MNQARVGDITQINNLVYYDSNNEEEDDEDIFHNTIKGEVNAEFDAEIEDTAVDVHGEPTNNEFCHLGDQHKEVTGTKIEQDGVTYVHKCLLGELYYTLYEIYSDDPNETEKSMTRIARSTSLFVTVLLFKDKPRFQSELAYDQRLLEVNQRISYQRVLDNCHDVGITETDLHDAQEPLKSSIRRPVRDDWKRRKYFGNVLTYIV